MKKDLLDIFNVVLDGAGLDTISELKADADLREDLELDSINLAELTVRIEEKFDVDVFQDGLVNTVGEILLKLNKDE